MFEVKDDDGEEGVVRKGDFSILEDRCWFDTSDQFLQSKRHGQQASVKHYGIMGVFKGSVRQPAQSLNRQPTQSLKVEGH